MFFSIGKIFWLAVILWGVWTAFRIVEKRQRRQKEQATSTPNNASQNANKADAGSVDMRECPTCKSWVGAAGCNHPDCPIK